MTHPEFCGTANYGTNSDKHAENPNIFQFATKELSQDAVLGWLCAWADSKYKQEDAPELHELGKKC